MLEAFRRGWSDPSFGPVRTYERLKRITEMNDGGPVYPSGDQNWKGEPGMMLRDWLAGKALTLIDRNLSRRDANLSHEAIAKEAYLIADAMIKSREASCPT